MPSLGIEIPADLDKQRIAAMIYAESSTAHSGGGDDPAEKTAVGQTIINRSIYANLVGPGGNPCYNSSFGSGTILSAVKNGFAAYGGPRWSEVTTGDVMKTRAALEGSLDQGKLDHLRLSIVAANALAIGADPINNATLGGKPVAFNQATNTPPSTRMQLLGTSGALTFYRFKTGHECA